MEALRIYTWSFLSIGQIFMVKKDITQTDIEIGLRKLLYELIFNMIEQKPNNNSCFLLLKQPSLKPSDQKLFID